MIRCLQYFTTSFRAVYTLHRNMFCRAAVIHFFMLEGLLAGLFASQLPTIQDNSELSDSALGSCVLFLYFGTVLATLLAGKLIETLGSKWATIGSALLFICALPFIGMNPHMNFSYDEAQTRALLSATMFWFGFTLGLMDVAMNSCGVVAEIVENRPLMGSFHGSYSIAAAIAAFIGSSLSAIGWSPLKVFIVTCIICIFTTLLAGSGLYKAASEDKFTLLKNVHTYDTVGTEESDMDELFRGHKPDDDLNVEVSWLREIFPNATTLFLCAVGFLASYGEGGMVTWAVIYYERFLKVSDTFNSLGYITFMVCMACGRFLCDTLRERFGRRKLVRVGGILACGGLLLAVFAPLLPLAVVFCTLGLALTGAGLSTLIPTVFSSAGHLPNQDTGKAIATVAAFTYSGSILSPPMIGAMSTAFDSLRLSFLVVAFIFSPLFFLSFGVPREIKKQYAQEPEAVQDDTSDVKGSLVQ